jgi:hypothetical protein
MKKRVRLTLPFLGLLVAFTLSPAASADTIGLSLASPDQTAAPGSTLSFFATVSAPLSNLASVFLNSDSTTVDFPLTLDDSPFSLTFPLSLNPGDSFAGVLFTVAVPAFAPLFTTYNGYFEIDGGTDSNAADNLASVTFQVSTAPEPQGLLLLLIGLSGLALALRFKRSLN